MTGDPKTDESKPTIPFLPDPDHEINEQERESVASKVFCYARMKMGDEISPHAIRVAVLLDRWIGLHHIPSKIIREVDWSDPWCVEIAITRSLGTYDLDEMTRLVFLAHDLCVRVEVFPNTSSSMNLMFHPRVRHGGVFSRHPTIEQAITSWRRTYPIPARPVRADQDMT